MLTWRNFYKELGVDIKIDCDFQEDKILVYGFFIYPLIRFLVGKGFTFNLIMDMEKISSSPNAHLNFPYISIKNSHNEQKTSRKFNLYEVLIYIASVLYFRNTTALSFEDFRIYTNDGYDISLVRRKDEDGKDEVCLVIGDKLNESVTEYWHSNYRFAFGSNTRAT